MRASNARPLALAAALACFVAGCQTESRSIPLISEQAAAELPAAEGVQRRGPSCALPLQHSRNRLAEPQSRRLRQVGLYRPRQQVTPGAGRFAPFYA